MRFIDAGTTMTNPSWDEIKAFIEQRLPAGKTASDIQLDGLRTVEGRDALVLDCA